MLQNNDEDVPLAEAVRATLRMLEWRGHTADPADHPAFAAFGGTAFRVRSPPEVRTVLLVTGVLRTTSQQVRNVAEGLEPDERLQLVSKHPITLHAHLVVPVTVLPWVLSRVPRRGGGKKYQPNTRQHGA